MYCRSVLVRADQYDTENFMAGMFYSQEQIEKCLRTPMFPEKLPAQHVAQQTVDDDTAQKESTDDKGSKGSNHNENHDSTYNLENDAFEVNVTGAVSNVDDSSILTKYYITYEFTITRLTDSFVLKVYHRFRDIKAIYHELAQYEQIASNKALLFPTYEDNWLTANKSDPETEIVQKRKVDLQKFFCEFFRLYPKALYAPMFVKFLELELFPAIQKNIYLPEHDYLLDDLPEHSSLNGAGDGSSSSSGDHNKATYRSDWVYNPRTGKMEYQSPITSSSSSKSQKKKTATAVSGTNRSQKTSKANSNSDNNNSKAQPKGSTVSTNDDKSFVASATTADAKATYTVTFIEFTAFADELKKDKQDWKVQTMLRRKRSMAQKNQQKQRQTINNNNDQNKPTDNVVHSEVTAKNEEGESKSEADNVAVAEEKHSVPSSSSSQDKKHHNVVGKTTTSTIISPSTTTTTTTAATKDSTNPRSHSNDHTQQKATPTANNTTTSSSSSSSISSSYLSSSSSQGKKATAPSSSNVTDSTHHPTPATTNDVDNKNNSSNFFRWSSSSSSSSTPPVSSSSASSTTLPRSKTTNDVPSTGSTSNTSRHSQQQQQYQQYQPYLTKQRSTYSAYKSSASPYYQRKVSEESDEPSIIQNGETYLV